MTTPSFRGQIEAQRDTPEYATYRELRDRVLDMLEEAMDRSANPSDFWEEELGSLDYILDASPLVIRKLRQHCTDITGLRAFDYRSHHARPVPKFAAKLAALQELDDSGLFVPEPPDLGGFGHLVDGAMANIDTLKFYECMIALDKAGALTPFQQASADRRTVLEIGAGWGGFAYQFKTLFPNVTYVIVDLPLMLIFSGVYLKTLFPGASLFVYGQDSLSHLEQGWGEYDFVLLPHFAIGDLRLSRLDLAINMCSFMEMTAEQVDAYARRVRELDCPSLYSFNRERSKWNTQLESVSAILERYYEVEELHILDVPYFSFSVPRKKPYVERVERRAHPLRHPRWALRQWLRRRRKTPLVSPESPNPEILHDYKHLLGQLRRAAVSERQAPD